MNYCLLTDCYVSGRLSRLFNLVLATNLLGRSLFKGIYIERVTPSTVSLIITENQGVGEEEEERKLLLFNEV